MLDTARQVISPNCDARPDGVAPDLIVVHGISLPPGEYGGPWIERLFTNAIEPKDLEYFAAGVPRVSAHAVIARDGAITQYVKFDARAWHAGPSSYEGRDKCNDFSIGIELEGTDTEPYDPAQYRALGRLIAALCDAYPTLSPERVVGHSDVAPGRKTDPGPAFDWHHARYLIDACCSAARYASG
jgi:AmpD protein